ncbi:MAG: 6-bladed beta-propeller [Methanothrix sp.]|nr:6-bladed beta-propeller [Methanothrix sp.]
MRSVRRPSAKVSATALLLLVMCVPSWSAAGVKATFLYSLSNFSGIIPFNYVREFVDPERNEIYVVTGDSVSIFNSSGMEVYRFGDDLKIGVFLDLSVEDDGHILILSRGERGFRLTRCNYRGEPQEGIEIRNLPKNFTGISPTRLLSRNAKLYLADLTAKKVAVTDANGVFQVGYDIAPLLTEFEEKPGTAYDIVGITVDAEGNLFFTVPTMFHAFRLSPDGRLATFGSAGNIPGKFNLVSGIATDRNGNIYVSDILRSTVSVFNKEFKFTAQFSQRGLGPGDLIAPSELVIDKSGKLYVSQSRNRGISVFRVDYE